MNKVFLGGTTAGEVDWRNELIPFLERYKVDYFNPIVENWDENAQVVEEDEKNNECNIHLYVITKDMIGVYSIAELVESCFNKSKTTIFYPIYEGFNEHQKKSLEAVTNLVLRNSGLVVNGESWEGIASFLHNWND